MPPRRDPTLEDTLAALVDKLDQILLATNTSITQNASNHDALTAQLSQQTEITAKLATTIAIHESAKSDPTKEPFKVGPSNSDNTQPRPPKILLPTFDGSNPLDWIFQAENYFTYYSVPPTQRLALTVFYFTGDALSWYKHLASNNLLGSWTEFTRALELRFGPSTFENHEANLFKLRQTTTVSAYQTEFERLSNCVVGLSPDSLRNCFISGLRSDIQSELATHHPATLHQAYGLAKLIEDKFSSPRNRYTPSPRSFSNLTTQHPKPYHSPLTTSTTTPTSPPLLPSPPKTTQPLPFTRLSPEALQKRRADGLCFRCPEKFHPGHKCNPPQFLLIADNDHETDTTDTNSECLLLQNSPDPIDLTNPDFQPQFLSLSPAAFYGLHSYRTLRVTG